MADRKATQDRLRSVSNLLSLANMTLSSAQSAVEHGRAGTCIVKTALLIQYLESALAEARAAQ